MKLIQKNIRYIEENSSKYGLINYSQLNKKNADDDSETVNRVGV